MKTKKYTPVQIVTLLEEARGRLAEGTQPVADVCRTLGISPQTYYRWRREYGGLDIGQATRLKALEEENSELKKVVADLMIDKAILKEASRRKL